MPYPKTSNTYPNSFLKRQPFQKKKRKFLVILAAVFFVLIALSLGVYFYQFYQQAPKPEYRQLYRLVPEKISQSAAIKINLPPGVKPAYAKQNIKFEPELEGKWLAQREQNGFLAWLAQYFKVFAVSDNNSQAGTSQFIYYQPAKDLHLNRYYAVELALQDGGVIKADFLAVENPEISAIFPQPDSEVPEDSDITIVFNRPMVALTTLGELEKKEVPVEIRPETEGRFKWITTRNLQFIPEERLFRSTRYSVEVKAGLQSMDGLKLAGQSSSFMTRKLRYVGLSRGETIYNQPISIRFNQPVDLERTKKEIKLINETTGKQIDFIAEYGGGESLRGLGERAEPGQVLGLFDWGRNLFAAVGNNLGFFNIFSQDEDKSGEDKTVIRIYNSRDRFGRKKLWDFDNVYSLLIKKAYPLEGDINLDESRSTNFNITTPIRNIYAESERTSWASPDFFDPQGKLWVEFYEEIDLSQSRIEAGKLKKIDYGLKCKEDVAYSSRVECEKVVDKKKIFLEFKQGEIGLGETIEVNFKKIVNTEGLKINQEPIKKYIKTYPEFKILKTSPANGHSSADLTRLEICSNSPILAPSKEHYSDYFRANLDYEINRWAYSRKITSPYYDTVCAVGQFSTKISYGLMPLANYSLDLKLKDVFSQEQELSLTFTTGPMPSKYLSFYQLQDSYVVASPEKKKLTYAAKNFDELNVDICKLSPVNFLYYLENRPRSYEAPGSIVNCQQRVKDIIELPKRYWLKNYFHFDIGNYFAEPKGHYIITFSHPDYQRSTWYERDWIEKQRFERTYLSVTNLGVGEKKIDPQSDSYSNRSSLSQQELSGLKNLYWVTNLSDLSPVTGAKVSLYQGDNFSLAGNYYTNEQGIALTDVFYNLEGAVISKGGDSTVIPTRSSALNWASTAYSVRKIYLYTDKPIYRPGSEVFIKGIYRAGYDGQYQVLEGKEVELKVYNSKNDEILDQELTLNEFGTFNSSLNLEPEAPLGNYRYCLDNIQCSYFDVQEYQPAAFEVKVATDKAEYISKDTAKIEVEANYYFGVPLEGGKVTYTISSQDYYFDRFAGSSYNFGSGWSYWSPYYKERFLLRGETSLSEEGKAEIAQELDFEKLFKDEEDRKSKIMVVDITVTNLEGQSISNQKSFIVHAGNYYLGLKPDRWFLSKNQEFNLNVKSVDVQGKEISVEDLKLGIYKTEWIRSKRQEAGGGYAYKWEKKKELIKEYSFSTDRNGNYSQTLSIAKEGSYEAKVWGQDKRGNLISSSHNLYVYGTGVASVKPSTEPELEIEATKTDLNVGDIAEVIVKSPYAQAKALFSLERGKIFDYQIKEIEGNLYKYQFPIKEEYLPNVYLSVLVQSSKPEVKFGQIEFNIDTERKDLNIEVSSNKQRYLPGEEVSLDIKATDYRGQPVSAELSLAVVDLSVLALKGNIHKNPLVFFYGGFPLTVETGSNIKNILVEREITTKGGSGGGLAAEVAASGELARKVRGEFRQTAFWQAVVRTDEQGKAQVSFTLPDNLTTWQTETLGITKESQLGIDYSDFMTRKQLMLVPLKPRFVVPGDSFYIGAKVFNQTSDRQAVKINLASDTLILEDSEKSGGLRAGETNTYYFKVKAPEGLEKGKHRFALSAKGQGLEDTVIQEIDIVPNDTYEVTATANYTTDALTKEYVYLPGEVMKDKGSLTIQSSATLAVFLSDALNYLLQFPYGCSEQITSKLKAIAVVKRGLNLPNLGDKFSLDKVVFDGQEYEIDEAVAIGLAKLYNNQNFDGGFSFWGRGRSNFHLSLNVLEAFNSLKLAGYSVNQQAVDKLINYLTQELLSRNWYYNNNDIVILTGRAIAEANPSTFNSILRQKIISIVNSDLYLQDIASNYTLVNLAILLEKQFDKQLVSKVAKVIDNRIEIDARGAFLEPNQNHLWYHFETTIKDTAFYLKALSIRKEQDPRLDKIVRWLLNSKHKDGSWGSTNNTLAVIEGLVEFLEWQRETESDFTLNISVDERQLKEFRFYQETILEQLSSQVPLKELKIEDNNIVKFEKTNHNRLANTLYYDLSLKYYLPIENLGPRDEGFSIVRTLHRLEDKENKNPIHQAKVGDVLRVHLQVTVPKTRKFVAIEDFIPAGMEIVNLDLATEQKSLRLQEKELQGRELYPDFKELYDDRALLYVDELKPGVYEFDYFVRALIKGKFIHLPARASEMYFPENFGRTSGSWFEIK